MKALLEKIRKLLRDRRVRKFWHRSLSVFAAVVVFITTYALVLPAITLEKTAACGIEEHQHNKSCYESRLVCGQEESEGHHHDDSCYTVTKELVCDLEEHQHSDESGCYDKEGNLICEIPEHAHDSSCYKEIKTLTCGKEESEGHHHTDACYEEVLVCGKEAHTHSAECYKEDSSAVSVTEEAAGGASTVTSGGSVSADYNTVPGESAEDGNAGMTDVAGESAVSDPSVPQLDPVDMDAVMTKSTGFYYFHAEEDEDIPANSSDITNWQEVKEDTKLASTDLVKAYFTYKIPAGSLNESNPVARYRLPGNIHLTDDQIDAINHTENGVYASMDSGEEARKYLGAEAVEGDRKPDEKLRDGTQEYISAVVRAENVYDEEDHYLGQDLIFTFVPYSIEKNQNTYDADGSQITAGEKIIGWFACDFTLSQIDWVKEETDLDNSTIEKSAEVVFVEENKENGTKEISTVLKLIENDDTEAEDGTETDAEDTDTAEYQSGTLTADGDGYKITLDYTEEAKIPANAELSVKEITPETDKEAYEACLEQAKKQVTDDDKSTVDETASRFFDIEIVVRNIGDDADESESVQKIEPAAPVSVNIQITDTSRNADSVSESGKTEQSDPTVLHFAEEGVEQIDSTVKGSSEQENGGEQSTEVQFEAESFSVYGVVYTVDFHWEVNGKTYDFSIPGGDSVSFRELVEALHVIDGEAVSTINKGLDEFIDDIEDIRFSDESLVKVARITDDTTARDLKEKLGIESEYNSELSKKQKEEIDTKVFYAPDWALVSMKAFDTVETLTVTLKTGEVFRIAVTDAQIIRDFISASGKTYTITVTYSENAEIPEGADLRVREILSGSVEEAQYITASAFELGVENKDIHDARFFDIEIIDAEGQKIEPKTPVDVKIEYKDPVEITGDNTLSVLHFADDGTEIIREVSVSDEGQTIEYEQDSFSITGTIVSPEPQNGSADNPRRYMLLVQHEGKYYIVNNDASLTEVSLNPDGTVNIEDPMMWSYEDNHIYYQAEAVDFTSQDVASDYLYRYLNASAPEDDNAYRQEEKNSSDITTWNRFNMFNMWFDTDGDRIDQRDVSLGAMGFEYGNIKSRANRHLWNDMSISYTNNHLYHNNNYLGIEFDEDGVPVRLIGSQSQENAANIVFASANSVPGVDHNNHTVNHIDISITGKSQISVPLAYGTYYYKDENDDFQEYVVNKDIDLTLTKEKIDIEPEDMKGATIKAFDKNGDELHNAFVITGYSSNSKTDYSTPQVRIEGQFKVANLPWMNVDEYNANDNAMSQRLQNIITYTVSATKPITFPLIETDNGYGQLYEKQKDGTYKEISITVDIGMSASFNYWGEDNECPPLQPEYGYTDNWKKGGIHPFNISGMDFKLGGDADNASNHMASLEITKMVLDENHHMIKLDKPYEQSFKVYGSSTNKHGSGGVDDYRNVVGKNLRDHTEDYNYGNKYTELHSKDVTVGSSGMGLVFDYDIEPGGMYYIEEDTSDVPKTIKDEDNNEWTYAYTYIETEYVWRNDGYSGRHESGKYTGLTDGTYISMPEVAGSYTGSHDTPPNGTFVAGSDQNSSNWRWFNEKTGLWEEGVYWNGFLEYYVYNVYTQGTKLDVEKEWKTPDIPDNAEVTVELYYATKMVEDKNGTPVTNQSFPESYEEYQPAKNAKIGDKSIFDGVTTEIILKADDEWKNTFENLPITVKDAEGNIYEVDYYAKEKSVKIPGEGSQTIDEYAQDITGRFAVSVVKENPADASEISDGKVTISNDKQTVQVTVKKKWEPEPEGGSISVELHRYAVKSDGTYSLFVKDQYGTGVPGATVDLYKGEEKLGTYTTDENGNLSVSGLKPGTYKYVQTAAPTGYEMGSGSSPVDSLEAESFTVDDDETQEQSKRVELVNQVLKSTGTVTLTVLDNQGQPVRGGAQFDLYKGNEIVEGKSGLVTGNDGKIIVKGLEAGTYKFVQTGTPSDYKMPSNTETDGFTVAENPGVEQSFTQTMTNTLRGKGTVSVTLKDNSGNPIGGVKFSLLKDDAEVDSGYTDENGSLVFGNPEMLDEGIYVIHQATAKDGFDLAANQSFEVVEGDAEQTFEKNFINQPATGNVNLVLMRKFGTSDGNQWSKIGNTITGLKVGTTYTIRATTNNKDMIQSHLWYFEAEGTYSNGTVPNQANMTQNWSAADWTIDGNTATKTFTFTPNRQNTTYTIALITDWSVNDLSLEVVRDRSGNVSGLQSSPKAATKMRFSGERMRATKGAGDAPSNPSFTDAEPAEAPEGYANEGTFSIPGTITGPDWTYTFPPQDKYDASGNEYKYYVVETVNTLSDYYIKSYSGDPLSENGTITITNAIKPGALTITKEVKVNGNDVPDLYKTIADGTYTFSITGPDNYSEERTITVTNGAAGSSIVLTGLKGGNYTITETGSTNNNGISLDGPKTINVVPGSEASANIAAFVNNLVTTNLVLEKVSMENLGNPNAATLKGAAFRLEKYTNGSYQQKDPSWTAQAREDSDNTGIFTFINLTKGYYKIVETKWPDGYIKVENDPRLQIEYNDGVYSIKLLTENGSVLQEEDATVIKIKPSAANPTVQFGNKPGAALPNTGGPGTRLFTILGSILIFGAGVLLWRRRRLI